MGEIVRVVESLGFVLVLVDLDPDDDGPGSGQVIARDAAGRTFPAHAELVPQGLPPHYWFVRHPGAPRREWPPWRWATQR
ncbi:MAG TPA: hypothetical protein VHM65_06145 [Candidatus Lustribacter sp.]|nr:hypothetical protein [Candidatus Lustribacter sp.]